MALRYALLGSLADQPRTGYALLKHFQQSLAYAWPASHSQIYPELARLLDGRAHRAGRARGAQLEDVRDDRGRTRPRSGTGSATPHPDRRVRSDAALRGFFLWLLEPARGRPQLEGERTYWQGVLDEFLRIREEPTGHDKKARTLADRARGRHPDGRGARRLARRCHRRDPVRGVATAGSLTSVERSQTATPHELTARARR